MADLFEILELWIIAKGSAAIVADKGFNRRRPFLESKL